MPLTPFISDTLNDAGAHSTFLEAHTVATGGPWVPATLPLVATNQMYFTTVGNGNRLRAVGTTTNGYVYMATAAAPGDGQCTIVSTIIIPAGTTGAQPGDKVGFAFGGSTTVPQFLVTFSRGAQAWRLLRVNGDGTIPQVGTDSAFDSFSAGVSRVITCALRNNGGHPRYTVTSGGSTLFDITDAATSYGALGAYRGLYLDASGEASGGNTDQVGLQFTGAFTVTEYVTLTPSPTTATATVPTTLTVTGVNTGWTNGTTPLGLVSGPTGAGITAQVVNAANQTVTCTLAPGSAPGTVVIQDTATAVSFSVTVNALALALTPPAAALAGVVSQDIVLTLNPPTGVPGGDALVTIDDSGALGTFSGGSANSGQTQVLIGAATTQVRVTYTAPLAAAGTTVHLRATATGYTTAAATLPIQAPATEVVVTGPPGGAAGVASAPFTAALPAGTAVATPLVVTPIDGGAGGRFSPPSSTLPAFTPGASTTFLYYPPPGIATRVITLTNSGGLANSGGVNYAVTSAADYLLAGPTAGPMDTASGSFVVSSVDIASNVTLAVTLSDGQQAGQQGTWHLAADGTLITGGVLTLTDGSSIPVTYTPPVGYTGTLALTATNAQGYTDPATAPYDVYDPNLFWAPTFAARYTGFAGQAASLGFTVYGPGIGAGRQVLIPHMVGYTQEGGAGTYYATKPIPRKAYGTVEWDVPEGSTSDGWITPFDTNDAIGAVLSPTDLGNLTTELQRSGGGVRLASFAALGVTTPTDDDVRADPNALLKAMSAGIVNQPEVDAGGNLVYKQDDGQTPLFSIPVHDDEGTFSLGAPV
jgi:hypothetical protein